MNSKLSYYLMLVMLAFSVVTVIGTVYAGDKLMSKKSSELASLKLESLSLEKQREALAKAKKDIAAYSELNDIAIQIVPHDKDQARSVRELYDIANEQNIKITGISFPNSNLGDTSSKTKNSSPSTGQNPKVTQAEAVPDIPGLYAIKTNVTIDSAANITYGQLLAFLERLENNRRTAQVSNISIQPNPRDRNLISFNLSLTMYIKP